MSEDELSEIVDALENAGLSSDTDLVIEFSEDQQRKY